MRSRVLSGAVAPHLVGRAQELQQFDELTRRVIDGDGAVVCVVGEPGIGKTALLTAIRDALQERGTDVHEVALDETDRRRPLAIVRALFPGSPHSEPGRAIDRAIGVVELLAAQGPVALLVDDLQWADDSSLDVVNAIARRAVTLGVLVAATTRHAPMSKQVARFQDLAEANGACLRPEPLDDHQVAELVADRVGARPGGRLLDFVASSAGNPFLLTELLTGLIEDGLVIELDGVAELVVDAPLPVDLSRRLATRTLTAMPSGELLVRAAAVMPGGVTVDELAEILDLPISQVLVSALEGVELGVFVDVDTRLMFRHDLLRQSVLDHTPKSIRRTLSHHAAEVLAARSADPDRVTACLLEATDVDDPHDVARLLDIGRSYLADHPSAAADLLERALDGLAPGDRRIRDVVIALGWALVEGGRSDEVEALLCTWVGDFRPDEPISIQRLRGEAAALAGRIDHVAAHYADLDASTAMGMYDRNDAEAVDAIAELARLRASMGRSGEAVTLLDWVQASPTAPSVSRQVTIACVRSLVAAVAGRFEESATFAHRALSVLETGGVGAAASPTSHLSLAIALDQLGDPVGALRATTLVRSASAMPAWGPPMLQFFAGVTLFRRGDWDDALAEVDAGLRTADEAGFGMAAFWPPSVGALISTARGETSAAHRWLDHAHTETSSLALGREWLAYATALTLEADGDCDGAASMVAFAAEAIIAAEVPALLLNGGPEMVRLLLDGGRVALARTIADELASLTNATASPVVAALAGWSKGLIAGDPDPIVNAAEMLGAVPRVPEEARALADAAVVTARVGSMATPACWPSGPSSATTVWEPSSGGAASAVSCAPGVWTFARVAARSDRRPDGRA